MWEHNQNELYHYGVKGMRWGVRRDRSSSNGSIDLKTAKKKTEAAGRIVNESQNINNQVAKTRMTKAKKKQLNVAKQMDDKELREAVNRLNMEQQYVNLSTNHINSGRANVDAVLSRAGTVIAITNSALAIALAVKQLKG